MRDRISRLRGMKPEELWAKVRLKCEVALFRVLWKRGLLRPVPKDLLWLLTRKTRLSTKRRDRGGHEAAFREAFLSRESPVFFGFMDPHPVLVRLMDENVSEWRKRVVREADLICDHHFTPFPTYRCGFDEEIDWHLDCMTGKHWPMEFSPDMVFTGPNPVGDVKYVWELSRHSYLSTLGRAYWATGDEKYSREFVQQISSWIRSNPQYTGIHWTSALEAGLRVISWIWAYYFFRESPEMTGKFLSYFLRSMWSQVRFVERHLTLGFYGNNHLVGEAAGLYLGGLFLKGFKRANRWRHLGKRILSAQLLAQTHPDGVNVEQAAGYHRFCLDFFVLFKIVHERNEGRIPGTCDERLQRMFDFYLHILRPDGSLPVYGDFDNGRGIGFEPSGGSDASFLAVGAALYGRGDMKWQAGDETEDLIWLMGSEGLDAYGRILPEQPDSLTRLFVHGGHCVMRDRWDRAATYVRFNCGPLGYGSGAHGHADALSLEIWAHGRPALIDPGSFAYNRDPLYRDYFRRTRAHNTVTVDGKDQSEILDRMSWKTMAETTLRRFDDFGAVTVVSAENNGYVRMSPPCGHIRILFFHRNPAYCVAVDRLTCPGDHQYDLHFHFAPGCPVILSDRLSVKTGNDSDLYIEVRGSSSMKAVIKEGDPEPMGWYSRSYGHRVPSPSVTYTLTGRGEASFLSLMVPCRGITQQAARLKGTVQGNSARVTVDFGKFRDSWWLAETGGVVRDGNDCMEGSLAFVRNNAEGRITSIIVGACTRLEIEEKTVLCSTVPVNGPLDLSG